MDQKTLREIEKQCLQEEAPACQSACPLHVDVRTFVGQVRKGKWSDAWKTLNKTMPFPGILARICDHPCESSCLRADLGGSIRISDLEKACVKTPKPRIRTLPMPSKKINMAILGSELSSLVVALDLLRKGYRVTLFSRADNLGRHLLQMDENILPNKVVESELAILDSLGLQQKNTLPSKDELEEVLTTFEALYIGLDDPDCNDLLQEVLPDPKTRALPGKHKKGQFVGGNISSPILQAFTGRAAALSMERTVQRVSLSHGRQDEGSYSTRLFTNTEGVESLGQVVPKDPREGYTQEEAREEAARCIDCQCLECLKVCPYLDEFNGYPKRYAREIYNNASIVQGHHTANLMINSCSLCGLCTEICPGNFSMADLCLDARRDMVERRFMPPSAHEFALQDMHFSNSGHFHLAHHAKDKDQSRFAFFPGCQLSGSDPEKTAAVYHFLSSHWSEETGLILQCCGAPAYWAGNEAETHPVISLLRQNWQKMGAPKLIVACSSCLEMLGKYLPEIDTISLWEVLDRCELPQGARRFEMVLEAKSDLQCPGMNGYGGSAQRSGAGQTMQMAIHDPCTTRHSPEIQSAARSLAEKLGIQLQELEFGREKTECCGFGGLMRNANPEMAKKQIERRATQSVLDYLVYCAVCRENLRGNGKRSAHLLDFLFPGQNETDPAARVRISISERRDNRISLKRALLAAVGVDVEGESDGDLTALRRNLLGENQMIDGKKIDDRIQLHISTAVATKLEDRRILHDDIRQVIAHAEATGQKMQSEVSGHFLASYRPHLVTFWVQYSPAEIGYHIYNGYSHRMEIKGGNA